MTRPRRNRRIACPPMMEGFKPFGIPIKDLEPVILFLEEFESIRLADFERNTQEEAALKMNVSRPTFTRIYDEARFKISQAFVEGKALFFEGGHFETEDHWYRCNECLKLTISDHKAFHCLYCNSSNIRDIQTDY